MEEQEKKSFGKKLGTYLKMLYMALTSVTAMACLLSATYAWFTANSVVQTDRVSGRTGTDQVVLQVAKNGGEDFLGQTETDIVQVNRAGTLQPVSTADLRTFVYSAGTVGDDAIHFLKVEEERYYYHGRFYLRAFSEGHSENARLALYLDGADGNVEMVKNKKGYLANAARLGLVFDNANAKILRISEASNPDQDRKLNTVLNGQRLTAGQVIDSAGETLRAVADPSEAIGKYVVGADINGAIGATPLLWMELNHIYVVDVYFYLEGCDPDCSDVTRMDELDLHLAFYGVLTEG